MLYERCYFLLWSLSARAKLAKGRHSSEIVGVTAGTLLFFSVVPAGFRLLSASSWVSLNCPKTFQMIKLPTYLNYPLHSSAVSNFTCSYSFPWPLFVHSPKYNARNRKRCTNSESFRISIRYPFHSAVSRLRTKKKYYPEERNSSIIIPVVFIYLSRLDNGPTPCNTWLRGPWNSINTTRSSSDSSFFRHSILSTSANYVHRLTYLFSLLLIDFLIYRKYSFIIFDSPR